MYEQDQSRVAQNYAGGTMLPNAASAKEAYGQIGKSPTSQYENLCERISKAIAALHGEIVMMRSTATAVLPAEVTGTQTGLNGAHDPRPPEHNSPMMCFMRHVEGELQLMRQSVEDIRVRLPF